MWKQIPLLWWYISTRFISQRKSKREDRFTLVRSSDYYLSNIGKIQNKYLAKDNDWCFEIDSLSIQ